MMETGPNRMAVTTWPAGPNTAEYDAFIPEVAGTAYLTGFHQFVIDPADPQRYGFHIG
jgi:proline racemase